MQKIAGVTVLYNPQQATLENIKTYIDHVDVLYIVDNSDIPHPEFGTIEKAVYIPNNDNLGIANALNQGAELALENGYKWLLTMDQDTCFNKEDAEAFFNCFEHIENPEQYAIIAQSFKKRVDNIINYEYELIDITVTSGNLLNLRLFKEIGKFNEDLFIDQVDHDYNLRAILKGYKILKFKNIHLAHNLGATILNNENLFLHSPVRVYYQVRNYLYLLSNYYKHFPGLLRSYSRGELKRLVMNIIFGKNNKLEKITMMCRGARDFINSKYGRYGNDWK